MRIWRNILGFEGLYQASNYGEIRRLGGLCSDGKSWSGRILKQSKTKSGYLVVDLCKNGKSKQYRVHRLVWEAFNGPIPEGMQVNHINEDKTDNCLVNLNLMTPKENTNWGTGHARAAASHTGKKHLSVTGGNSPCVVKVNQYTLDGEYITTFNSISEATAATHAQHGHISLCCQGKRHTTKGYRWSYA